MKRTCRLSFFTSCSRTGTALMRATSLKPAPKIVEAMAETITTNFSHSVIALRFIFFSSPSPFDQGALMELRSLTVVRLAPPVLRRLGLDSLARDDERR